MRSEERTQTLLESAEQRINQFYSADRFNHDAGALIDKLINSVEDTAARWQKRSRTESLVEGEKADVRPTSGVVEWDANSLAEHTARMKKAIWTYSNLEVQVATRFEDQFVPLYLPRVFPCALSFECGFPEHIDIYVQGEDNKEEPRGRSRRPTGLRRPQAAAVFTRAPFKEFGSSDRDAGRRRMGPGFWRPQVDNALGCIDPCSSGMLHDCQRREAT